MSKSVSLLVVGSLHYDIMVKAPKLPDVDETVLGTDVYFKCGGKGGNQAVAASRHGAKVRFAGAVGRDFYAEAMLKNLMTAGVDTARIQRIADSTSGMSVAMNLPDGDYGAVVASGANLKFDPEELKNDCSVDLLLLQNELAPDVNLQVAQRAKLAGAKIILNAAPMRNMDEQMLDLTDVLIVNRIEGEALFGNAITTPEAAIDLLDLRWESEGAIIVTLGGQGSVLKYGAQSAIWTPAYNVGVLSTHGAGDVFVGSFAACVASGRPFSEAIDYATAAAALHVSSPADRLDSIAPEQVLALMNSS